MASPMSDDVPSRPRRDDAVDATRFLGFAAVVLLHVMPNRYCDAAIWHLAIDGTSRFAVPAFFMIAGMMLARSSRSPVEDLKRRVVHLVPVFLFWEVVFQAMRAAAAWKRGEAPFGADFLHELARIPIDGGFAFHLWYIPWMLVTCAVFLLGMAVTRRPVMMTIAVACLLAGVAIGPYDLLPGPMAAIGAEVPSTRLPLLRDSPVYWLFFLCLGHVLGTTTAWRRIGAPTLVVLAAAGWALQLFERSHVQDALWADCPREQAGVDMVLGTVLWAVAVVMLAVGHMPAGLARLLAPIGRWTLGLYCVHGVFVIAFDTLSRHRSLGEGTAGLLPRIAAAAVIVVLSVAVVAVMARLRPFRRFVG